MKYYPLKMHISNLLCTSTEKINLTPLLSFPHSQYVAYFFISVSSFLNLILSFLLYAHTHTCTCTLALSLSPYLTNTHMHVHAKNTHSPSTFLEATHYEAIFPERKYDRYLWFMKVFFISTSWVVRADRTGPELSHKMRKILHLSHPCVRLTKLFTDAVAKIS